MSDQDIVAEDIAVFALPLSQSVALLSGLVHDTNLPDKVRQGAARLLIPHLQAVLARLEGEQACARQAPQAIRDRIREREPDYKGQVIGWA